MWLSPDIFNSFIFFKNDNLYQNEEDSSKGFNAFKKLSEYKEVTFVDVGKIARMLQKRIMSPYEE